MGFVVLVQHVSVEELTCLNRSVRWRVSEVVHALCRAGGSAERSIKPSTGEQFESHVSVGATHIGERIDRSTTKRDWSGVTSRCSDRVGHIAIGSGNDYLEFALPLTGIGCGARAQRTCIEDALDDCG